MVIKNCTHCCDPPSTLCPGVQKSIFFANAATAATRWCRRFTTEGGGISGCLASCEECFSMEYWGKVAGSHMLWQTAGNPISSSSFLFKKKQINKNDTLRFVVYILPRYFMLNMRTCIQFIEVMIIIDMQLAPSLENIFYGSTAIRLGMFGSKVSENMGDVGCLYGWKLRMNLLIRKLMTFWEKGEKTKPILPPCLLYPISSIHSIPRCRFLKLQRVT